MTDHQSAIDKLLTDPERKFVAWIQGGSMTPRHAIRIFLGIVTASLFSDWLAVQAQTTWLLILFEAGVLVWLGLYMFLFVNAVVTTREILEKYEAFIVELANRDSIDVAIRPPATTE